jgi:hypothetical protein
VLAISAAILSYPKSAFADEDGVSFWIPGFFGSLAAAPQQPGWSWTSMLYNTNVSASGNAAVAREVTIGEFPKFPISITGSANVHADATVGFVAELHVRDPVLRWSSDCLPPCRLWQQRYIIERDGDCYCAFTHRTDIHHKIHFAPAGHHGLYRSHSDVH